MTTKIVFLYTELSGYFLSCINELVKENIEVHIVRWPVNKEAPFVFDLDNRINLYNKGEYSRKQLLLLVKQLSPQLILTSGWVDKDYLYICKKLKKNVPTVMCMDNPWKGTFKQYIASLLSPFSLHKAFRYIWVAGSPQIKYAKKLGFKDSNTLTGFYSANTDLFGKIGAEKFDKPIPKRFIYIGRYVNQKGLDTLFKAFIELHSENNCDWELWCIGTGPLRDQAPKHDKIKHFGFVQPQNIAEYIDETGVFVLPSRYEPWGVVVHEMAAAGMPIISSDQVGSITQFVKDGENGYIFETDNITDLKNKMKNVCNLSNDKLSEMSKHSYQLGNSYTPAHWVKTLKSLL